MIRGLILLCGFTAFAAVPVRAQFWQPVQMHDHVAPQPLSRSPESAGGRREKSGTAFFVDNSGSMITARHAVEDCLRVVVDKEGRTLAARVVALSDRFDIALIKVPRTLGLAAVFPRNVTAVANRMVFVSAYDKLSGMQAGGGTLANATVTPNFGGSEAGYLVIDSNVTFGASGAPVLDSRGLVEGVISRRTMVNRVLAVGAAEAKTFLAGNGVRFDEDDRPQLAGSASRANRAASISARVTCLQN
ncbi:serine protease [Bradyrhizobium prioriisuperbiae]|uniref:S1 family peptidase n=1 Tax=Bradyrhizobium prioriisuperbiae TaxID=2854389 RepID=UPI0028E4B025|nr:serine protease [Bradyrhizobium prioritasuperba]